MHSGEVELRGNDVGGIAVNLGSRVSAAASPGEVLVSSTVRDLVGGSGIGFEDRGDHELKGVPDRWRLFAVTGPRMSAVADGEPSMIRVLLADDQALVRAGFRSLLDAVDDIRVVGEASDGEEAIRLATELRPDVALMDIRMPGLDGLAATRAIVEDESLGDVKIVILTTFGLDEYVFEAIRSGRAASSSRTPNPRS